MYQYFHKLRVRFAELEMKQGEVAKRANMAESTLTARMTGRLPWNGDEIARVAKALDIPTDQIGACALRCPPAQDLLLPLAEGFPAKAVTFPHCRPLPLAASPHHPAG